jgi:hypothetical protein
MAVLEILLFYILIQTNLTRPYLTNLASPTLTLAGATYLARSNYNMYFLQQSQMRYSKSYENFEKSYGTAED